MTCLVKVSSATLATTLSGPAWLSMAQGWIMWALKSASSLSSMLPESCLPDHVHPPGKRKKTASRIDTCWLPSNLRVMDSWEPWNHYVGGCTHEDPMAMSPRADPPAGTLPWRCPNSPFPSSTKAVIDRLPGNKNEWSGKRSYMALVRPKSGTGLGSRIHAGYSLTGSVATAPQVHHGYSRHGPVTSLLTAHCDSSGSPLL